MKLDHDCVRDLLLFLEKTANVKVDSDECIEIEAVWFSEICSGLTQYPKEVVFYALQKLDEGGYIDASIFPADDAIENLCVNSITYAGHEFLDGIRSKKRWDFIKKGLRVVGSYSLSTASSIAQGATAAAITAFLSANQVS